jgi:hypothetical protein
VTVVDVNELLSFPRRSAALLPGDGDQNQEHDDGKDFCDDRTADNGKMSENCAPGPPPDCRTPEGEAELAAVVNYPRAFDRCAAKKRLHPCLAMRATRKRG